MSTPSRSAAGKLAALIMITSSLALGSALGEASDMDVLLKKYETHVADILKPVDAKLVENLETFESQLADKGELEAAIAIREARLSLVLAPEKAPELSEFRKKHPEADKTLDKIRRAHSARVTNALRPARQTLVVELAKLEKKLTKAGQLKGALAAQKKRESVETELAWGTLEVEIPEAAIEWNGHRYHMFEEKVTWQEAKELCRKAKGHLVSITSKEENEVVLKLSQKQNCWLGATDEAKEGKWLWVTGEPFEFTKWHSRPDNHKGKQQYLFYWVGRGWDDTYGTDKYRFICEWEPPRR